MKNKITCLAFSILLTSKVLFSPFEMRKILLALFVIAVFTPLNMGNWLKKKRRERRL